MPGVLFVDTSGWYAAFNKRDRGHAAAAEALAHARAAKVRLVTSDYVLDETLTLVALRAGHRLAVTVGDAIWRKNGADIIDVDPAARDAAWRLFVKHGDHRLSFTDCTSAALARARGIDQVLSLDRHFRMFGFDVLPHSE